MQLATQSARRAGIRSFDPPVRCLYCGDRMVAPVASEFVETGEIRHHWQCEICGESSVTAIPLTSH